MHDRADNRSRGGHEHKFVNIYRQMTGATGSRVHQLRSKVLIADERVCGQAAIVCPSGDRARDAEAIGSVPVRRARRSSVACRK